MLLHFGHSLPRNRASKSRPGSQWTVDEFDGDQAGRLRGNKAVGLHGNRAYRTTCRAQSATDAPGFILEHGGPSDESEFVCPDIVEFHAQQIADVRKLRRCLFVKGNAIERDEFQTIFRADINAPAAQNALGARSEEHTSE